MFPLPRILYAMGSDGIIFKQLAIIHPKTMTPILGTVVSGLFTGIMTLIFDLQQLIDMMSIGTLLAYAIVAVSVLILRYMRAIIFKYVYLLITLNLTYLLYHLDINRRSAHQILVLYQQ